ncbi:MAG: thioredoxin [Candidatus Cyclobacteriaceae bacterium M3_2C_046]
MARKKSFLQLINQSEIPVLVDFFATWCGPCHTLSPIVQDVARDFQGKVKVIKIDVDKNQSAAMKYNIRGVPTLILFSKGKILWQQSGVVPKHLLVSKLNQFISTK